MNDRDKLRSNKEDVMKSNITITMTLAEVKDLRKCTVVAMDCLKEQVSQMDGGSHEKRFSYPLL